MREAEDLHRIGLLREILPPPLASDVDSLTTKTGLIPNEVPHLQDVLFRFAAMQVRFAEFTRWHQRIVLHHQPPFVEKAASCTDSDSVMVQAFIPLPVDYLLAMEGFLSESRKLVTQVILLVTAFHSSGMSSENVKLTDLLTKLGSAEPILHGDTSHQAILRLNAPEVAAALVNGSGRWLGPLKNHRDLLEHHETLANSFIEFYAIRHHGAIRAWQKVYSIHEEGLLQFLEEVRDECERFTVLSMEHLRKVMPKGTTEERVRACAFLQEVFRQVRTGSGIAPSMKYWVSRAEWKDVEAWKVETGREPRVFTFEDE